MHVTLNQQRLGSSPRRGSQGKTLEIKQKARLLHYNGAGLAERKSDKKGQRRTEVTTEKARKNFRSVPKVAIMPMRLRRVVQ